RLTPASTCFAASPPACPNASRTLRAPSVSVDGDLLEAERTVAGIDAHGVPRLVVAGEHAFGELILDVAHNRSLERPCAVLRIPALFDQKRLGRAGHGETKTSPLEPLVQVV